MKSLKNLLLFLIIFGGIQHSLGAVHSRSESGLVKKWNNTTRIPLYINMDSFVHPTMTDSSLLSMVNASAAFWYSFGNIEVMAVESHGSPKSNQNDFYFSSNFPGFGSGILGVTVTTVDELTGNILEGDIIMNTLYSNDEDKLQDVTQHEIGHLLGLGHSPVVGSTMFYQWVPTQDTLADDDQTGIAGKYPHIGGLNSNVIKGRVIGGSDNKAVFGAHVQAISENFGKVVGAAISETDGTFEILGLIASDSYYLYISPLKVLDPLPGYYSSVQNNFCEGDTSYVGGFFEGCNRRFEGHPQPIKLSGIVDVGDVTIHCGLKVPTNYYEAKAGGFPLLDDESFRYGESLVGYFTNNELAAQIPDYFNLDLTDRTDLLGKFIRVNLLAHSLGNELKFNLNVERAGGSELYNITGALDDSSASDLVLTIPLSTVASENNFTFKVTPVSSNIYNVNSAYHGQTDSRPFYFMNLYATEDSSTWFGTPSSTFMGGDTRVRIESESLCAEGVNVYSLAPKINLQPLEESAELRDMTVLSCSTVDFSNGSGGSGGGGLVLFVFSIFFLASRLSHHRWNQSF